MGYRPNFILTTEINETLEAGGMSWNHFRDSYGKRRGFTAILPITDPGFPESYHRWMKGFLYSKRFRTEIPVILQRMPSSAFMSHANTKKLDAKLLERFLLEIKGPNSLKGLRANVDRYTPRPKVEFKKVNPYGDPLEIEGKECIITGINPQEEHGWHLISGSDVLRTEFLARELEKALGYPYVEQIQQSSCKAGMAFPITINIEKTLSTLLYNHLNWIVEKYSPQYLVLLTAHGSKKHLEAMKKVSDRISKKHGIGCLPLFEDDLLQNAPHEFRDIHSGAQETSQVMYISHIWSAKYVDVYALRYHGNSFSENLDPEKLKHLPKNPLKVAKFLDWRYGVRGEPCQASLKIGQHLYEKYLLPSAVQKIKDFARR
jgi:creatinine amidohydrolase/Fe(II)-dependent formamide hydrolase-like protein